MGCLPFGVIMNEATINSCLSFCEGTCFIALGQVPRSGTALSSFRDLPNYLPKWLCYFYSNQYQQSVTVQSLCCLCFLNTRDWTPGLHNKLYSQSFSSVLFWGWVSLMVQAGLEAYATMPGSLSLILPTCYYPLHLVLVQFLTEKKKAGSIFTYWTVEIWSNFNSSLLKPQTVH